MKIIRGILFAAKTLISMAIAPILTISVAEHYGFNVELFDYLIIVYIALASASLVFVEKAFFKTHLGLSGGCGFLRHLIEFFYVYTFLNMIEKLNLEKYNLVISLDYAFYQTLIFVGIGINLFKYTYQIGYKDSLNSQNKKQKYNLPKLGQCPSCQNFYEDREKFCKYCGYRLR